MVAVDMACWATAINQNGAPSPRVAIAPSPRDVYERCMGGDYLY
jgi:hypothetical protein